MMRHKRKKQIFALMMAAVMAATCTAPALAAPVGDGVVPTCDEAYYATLDYYGNLMEGSVVKSYSLNGAASVTDYGVYDQVVNLTDSTPIVMDRESASFQFRQSPAHFYFEGKTAEPFQNLPWTVTLRYTLNGVPMRAEELAGKTGVVEILLDIVPNEKASDYARYNYTLEAMALFNEDDILSLEADGAQVQLVGNLRTVLFMCLPGEEQHFSIRVGSEDFSFSGLTILMVPATLAQLEEIAKLSQRKDDLEEDYRALSGSLDALLDAMYDIQDGLYASAQGLDQLDIARGTISRGKGKLYDEAGVLRGDLTAIADLLEPVEQRTLVLSQTITSSKAVLGNMTDTAVSLQTQLDHLEEALRGLESGASDVRQVIRGLADMKSSLRSLQRALGDSYIGGGSSGDRNTPKLSEQVEKTKQIGSIYSADDQQFFNQMLALQGKSAEEIAGINQLLQIPAGSVPEGMEQQWQAAWTAKNQMETLHKQSFRQFCDTLLKQQNPAMSDKDRAEQAKQMDDLWTIVKPAPGSNQSKAADAEPEPGPDNEESGENVPSEEQTEPGGEAEEQSPETGETVPEPPAETEPESSVEEALPGGMASLSLRGSSLGMMSGALAAGGLYIDDITSGDLSSGSSESSGGPSSDSSESGGGPSSGSSESGGSDTSSSSGESGDSGTPSDGGESTSDSTSSGSSDTADGNSTDSSNDTSDSGTSTDSSGSSSGTASGGQTPGGAAVDLIVGGLDQAMSAANDRINAIQSELNSTINRITRPTGRVVGELASLCDDVDDLVDLIDDAEDLSAALRQSSEKLRSILQDVDALRNILNEYEPTLQEAVANVGGLSTSAVAALRDLETLLANSEALMKTSGNQLDAGTRQSLRGLAATLRQTAKAMEATGDVKQAKLTINDIITDTWHEYTGDVNNILLMDVEAEAVSLTDSRNPAPSSVQVLIRTQEIKEEEPEETEEAAAAKAETTFWGRVAQMFKDFWKAVTGIFH